MTEIKDIEDAKSWFSLLSAVDKVYLWNHYKNKL